MNIRKEITKEKKEIYHFKKYTMSTFDENIKEWMDWSVKTFEKADHMSCLEKLEDEIKELRLSIFSVSSKIASTSDEVLDEYVDCIMCLLHSAAKYGFDDNALRVAFQRKFTINKMRTWNLNPNNTYSHAR